MLEAVHTDLVFTISLKRSTQNLQLSTSSPADYPIFGSEADMAIMRRDVRFTPKSVHARRPNMRRKRLLGANLPSALR